MRSHTEASPEDHSLVLVFELARLVRSPALSVLGLRPRADSLHTVWAVLLCTMRTQVFGPHCPG